MSKAIAFVVILALFLGNLFLCFGCRDDIRKEQWDQFKSQFEDPQSHMIVTIERCPGGQMDFLRAWLKSHPEYEISDVSMNRYQDKLISLRRTTASDSKSKRGDESPSRCKGGGGD